MFIVKGFPSVSSLYLMAFPSLSVVLLHCLLRLCVLSFPCILSLWHVWWFDIPSWCQTTRPYFPSAVLSPLSLFLPLSASPLLATIEFNLQQGLSGTAVGLPHHFFLPARGFAAVCSCSPMALPVVRLLHFLKLFICSIIYSFWFPLVLASALSSYILTDPCCSTVAPVWHVFALHLIIPSFNHCPIITAMKLSWRLWNHCQGLLFFPLQIWG